MAKTSNPRIGDKIWRQLHEEDKAAGKGANGTIRDIAYSTSEFIAIFPKTKGIAGSVTSRESYDRDQLDWTDSFGGTWYVGDIEAVG